MRPSIPSNSPDKSVFIYSEIQLEGGELQRFNYQRKIDLDAYVSNNGPFLKSQHLARARELGVEALVHEYPRVSAVAVTSMSGQSFAEALERAIQRSKAPLALDPPAVIEHEPLVEPSEMKRPFSRYRRY